MGSIDDKGKLVVVTNREPYIFRDKTGREWERAIGGVTAALDPIMQQFGGKWIAWGSSDADRAVARDGGRVRVPPDSPRYTLRYVWLSQEEVNNYYYGFSNKVLWPLCHLFHHGIKNVGAHWTDQQRVNKRFADVVLEETGRGDYIWIHDYQLSLVPRYVRERRPDARIALFWHIPFPPYEVFTTLPQRVEVLSGMLGSDLIGFHSPTYAINFRRCIEEIFGVRTGKGRIRLHDRVIHIKALPLGVDHRGLNALARTEAVKKREARCRNALGDVKVVLSVDRLDYTKGIRQRLEGIEAFFERHKEYRGKVTFIQCASPSRTRVKEYIEMKRQIDEIAGRINGRFQEEGWFPVHYHCKLLPYESVISYYRIADVALVTPLIDGLNLVVKEYVAVTDKGIPVISEFAGAAREMNGAIKVNPYNIDEIVEAIKLAIEMPESERLRRLRGLKRRVRTRDSTWWANEFMGIWKSIYDRDHLRRGKGRRE